MRKIHSHLAELIGRGFGTEAIQKRLNRNIRFTRQGNFGDIEVEIYGKKTFTRNFSNRTCQLNMETWFSQTYLGYINSILAGVGSSCRFNIKNGSLKAQNIFLDKDKGLYATAGEFWVIWISFADNDDFYRKSLVA